jgi:ribonuclease-3
MSTIDIKQRIEEDLYFKTAFTHRSFLNESSEAKESNERLEFLGDSVLSVIVSSHLFKNLPASYLIQSRSLTLD